jgi:hypothetical protein
LHLYTVASEAPAACWRLYVARYHALVDRVGFVHSNYARAARVLLGLQSGGEEISQPPPPSPR